MRSNEKEFKLFIRCAFHFVSLHTKPWRAGTNCHVHAGSNCKNRTRGKYRNKFLTLSNYFRKFHLDPSNKEKKEKIEAVAAEDLHRQENLYIEEIKRGGIEGVGINDIEFTYNISSGGWIVLPTTSKFPKYIYIPTVEGVVQSSLDLNRHLLDWDPKEDNFDLVRVKMNEPTVIFDKSNWSVVAHMNKENQVDKWYYPPTDTIITEKLKPEAAPYKINANFPMMGYEGLAENYEFFAKQFSNVTLEEDILSGKLLKYLLSYVAENPVFTDEVENVPMRTEITHANISGGYPDAPKQTYDKYYVFIDTDWTYTENPNKRPVKIISYFPFKDEKLFAKLGIDPIENDSTRRSGQIAPNWPVWLAAWAYKNPSGGVTVGLSEFDVFGHAGALDELRKQGKDFRPVPTYKIEILKVKEETLKKRQRIYHVSNMAAISGASGR